MVSVESVQQVDYQGILGTTALLKDHCSDYCSLLTRQIITFLQECESMQSEYNRLATSLLEWIEQTIIVLGEPHSGYGHRMSGSLTQEV